MLKRVLATLLLALVIGPVPTRWTSREDLPSQSERVERVARMEAAVLPVVRELEVNYFANERSCVTLMYKRGNFVAGAPSQCRRPTNDARPFDETAWADHRRVKAAIDASGTQAEQVGGTFGSDGHVEEFWFSSSRGAPFASAWSLIFDATGRLHADPFGMTTVAAVDGRDHWWFICCSTAPRARSPELWRLVNGPS